MKSTKGLFPVSAVWETPEIPLAPAEVAGVENAAIDLSSVSNNTVWEFLFESPNTVPLPTAENQDFDFSVLNDRKWESITVPGELAMQGYDIQNNTEYFYRCALTIPEDYADSRILLRFDGVYSNARVWINGKFIRSHVGGFTTWDCVITDFVNAGKQAELIVGVADLEGSDIGTYNPDGSKILGDSSWASYYAHHNIGGILRDVTLIALPQTYLSRVHSSTRFDDSFTDAEVTIAVKTESFKSGTSLYSELIDDKGNISATCTADCESEETALCLKIPAAQKWDAEHPNLYTLRIELRINGEIQQLYSEKIGLREIHYGGRNSTDSNKVYVNGKPVKLRGVCRHDVSFTMGRSTTREEDWAEIKAYKQANINHVRTSHYPASKHFLDACDTLGMYVEQENAACFQGANDYDIYCEPEDFISQFAEMVERDRNRASIIIWSLGNESGFNRTTGYRMEYDYIKAIDTSRPIIFSYPYTVEIYPQPYDIYSRHYENYNGVLGHPNMPVLHDEFAHLSCYNLNELRCDPNVRNFWGESIKSAWESVFVTDGALGVDLWCSNDDVFMLPEAVEKRFQIHSQGAATGYGEWGAVLDVYRRLKPEAYLTKKAFSPVRINEKGYFKTNNQLFIPVKNWFDHTCLDELKLMVSFDSEEPVEHKLPAIQPHCNGVIILEGNWSTVQKLQLDFYTADGEHVENSEIMLTYKTAILRKPEGELPEIHQTADKLTIKAKDFHVVFNKRTARLCEAVANGKTLLTGGPNLHTEGVTLSNWTSDRAVYAEKKDDHIMVVLQGRYNNLQKVQFMIRIYGDGTMETDYHLVNLMMEQDKIREFGISFDIASDVNSVEWQRQGLYSLYPENHIGRNQGRAYRHSEKSSKASYADLPKWSWEEDMCSYYLDPKNDTTIKATNDFKAMRENIIHYTAEFASGGSVRVEALEKTAARVQLDNASGEEKARLIINQQWYYPDLAWGNYIGDAVRLSISGTYGTVRLNLKPDQK